MHNKFKKLGLFVTKTSNKDEERNHDKFVKCLYQKEADKTHKSHASREEKHKPHRKKSTEKYKTYTSQAELFYIPPEEIKKHRRHKDVSPEKRRENETRKTVEKMLKEPKYKDRDSSVIREDHQWLTKKEVFKLINSAKYASKDESANNPALLKKFFLFEKTDNKPQHHVEKKKSEIITQLPKDASKSHRHKTSSHNRNNQLYSNTEFPQPHKNKTFKENEHFKFDDLYKPQKREHVEKVINYEHSQQTVSQNSSKKKHRSSKQVVESSDSSHKEHKKKIAELSKKPSKCDTNTNRKINRVNPKRHKLCLVKHTFPVIEIKPKQPVPSLEKKKKSKPFKKYYRYNNNPEEDYESKFETYKTYSDSHKMYQESSEQSFEERKTRKTMKIKNKIYLSAKPKPELEVETHVSSLTVKRKKEVGKSKIPILKPADASKELLPTFKSCKQRIVDAIASPRSSSKEDKPIRKLPKTEAVLPPKPSVVVKEKKSSIPKVRAKPVIQSAPPVCRRTSVSSSHKSSSIWSKKTSKSDTKLKQNAPTKPASPKPSSIWSRNNKKTSKSDTKLPKKSAKASLSNSTFGDKSFESSSRATSFFLTKSYKDDDKLTRWQKQKIYSDLVRKKNQKAAPIVPPQVLEVRYLTVSNQVEETVDNKESEKEFFAEDLPKPCMELVENDKFNALFELPTDKALNEILHENYTFLKKDFSFALPANCSSSNDELASINEMVLLEKKIDDWYDFRIAASISEISCCEKRLEEDRNRGLNIASEDHIVESCSAPGSEESGYATVQSTSFFERPDIKALLKPPIEIENNSSDECGIDIRSIESKSLQTFIACSQKSIQIKMSQEELLEKVNFGGAEPVTEILAADVVLEAKEVEGAAVLEVIGQMLEAIAKEQPNKEVVAENAADVIEKETSSSRIDNDVNELKTFRRKTRKSKSSFLMLFTSCVSKK